MSLCLCHPQGRIEEEEFLKTLFLDGREVDGEGLRKCMADNYEWIPGCEELLQHLRAEGMKLSCHRVRKFRLSGKRIGL